MVPRSILCSLTPAPGTTAPVSSVISPEIVAVSVWPIAADTNHNRPSTKPQATLIKRVIVIVGYPPFFGMPAKLGKFAKQGKNSFESPTWGLDWTSGTRGQFASWRGTATEGADYGWFAGLPK